MAGATQFSAYCLPTSMFSFPFRRSEWAIASINHFITPMSLPTIKHAGDRRGQTSECGSLTHICLPKGILPHPKARSRLLEQADGVPVFCH